MKIKLLALLLILLNFYSCKKKETTSLELDKSNTITLSGKVILTSSEGFTIPEGIQIGIAVANEHYGADDNNAKGDQIYYAPITDKGTYTFDLPLPSKTDASKITVVEFYLPTIFTPSGIVFSSETITKEIKFIDIEIKLDLEYSHKEGTEDGNVKITKGIVSAPNGVKLPANIIVTGATDENKIHSSTVNKNGDYELVYINTESIDTSDLAISPESFTSENGFIYFALKTGFNFNYINRTPIVLATSISYKEGVTITKLNENTQLAIELKDDLYSINETVIAKIDENNKLRFQIPDSFYKKNDMSRYIGFTIKFTIIGIDYSYSSSISMNRSSKELHLITLN